MIAAILHTEVQHFITNSLGEDVAKLALSKNPFPEIPWTTILNQIAAKQKAKTKLPTWFRTENIVYPSKISVEQTSSEITAQYKAGLVSGATLIDLTGGFGVDDYYFAKKTSTVLHCEINPELYEIAAHNFKSLGIQNIECITGDSTEILKQYNQKLDWIYIDPSRRHDAKGKVFMLRDCLPNVPELLDFYFGFASNIMIKTAPILDIAAGLSELEHVAKIHIVAVDNEVKELLWILEKNHTQEVEITTCNIVKDKKEIVSFVRNEVENTISYSLPKKYLYEPNAAIMKSGGFDVIPAQFTVEKLQQHSHLFTSDTLIDFPGRAFQIAKTLQYNKADMKEFLENQKANITTRNFPDSVETIRKKWKIKDGGNLYCFFTTNAINDKIVLLCSKI